MLLDTDGRPLALTNFHVAYRKALMGPVGCFFLRRQMNGDPSIRADAGTPGEIGDTVRQLYYPNEGFWMCGTRRSRRGPDAALIQLHGDVAWNNEVLGCEKLVIGDVTSARPRMLVAKSGGRTGLTFGIVDLKPGEQPAEIPIRKLSEADLQTWRHLGVVASGGLAPTDASDCTRDAVSCAGDSGAMWFAWPTDEQAWQADRVSVKAVALHHQGNGDDVATGFSMTRLLQDTGLRVAPITHGTPSSPGTTHRDRYGGPDDMWNARCRR